MSAATKIAWTDATWNPVRGCTRVSEGCRNCYAERMAARFAGPGQPYEGLATRDPARWTGKVRLVEEHLEDPLRWRKPRRVFVNSMSDLFHESLADETIGRIFEVMMAAETAHHTFQVLTKRPERMREFVTRYRADGGPLAPPYSRDGHDALGPKGNVWLGVSVEDQAAADERLPLLLDTPAAVRFASVEPLLDRVDLALWLSAPQTPWAHGNAPATWPDVEWPAWVPDKTRAEIESFWDDKYRGPAAYERSTRDPYNHTAPFGHCGEYLRVTSSDEWVRGRYIHAWNNIGRVVDADGTPHCTSFGPREPVRALDWVIVGGESGPGARPCNLDWIYSLVQQCRSAGVPAFVKQLGCRPCVTEGDRAAWWMANNARVDDCGDVHVRSPKGTDPSEWPEMLRVQEWPT